MAASDGANFQPAGTTVQVTNITVTTPERPDAPPDRLAKAREEARNEIHNQIVEQFPQTRQMLVDPRRIAQLRAHLITKYQLSERQATEVLKNYVNDPGNMISNRADTNVQNAMAGQGEAPQPPTGAAGEPNPNPATDAARADARPTDGRDLARMATRGGSATATPPPPPGSPTPPPKGTMTTATTATLTPPPPPPVPGGMTRGTSSALATTGGTPTDGTTGTPEAPTPQPNGDAPVLTATAGTPLAVPGAPAKPQGLAGAVKTFLYTSNDFGRGTGATPEASDMLHTAGQQFALLSRSGPVQVPVPMAPPRAPNDTFVARTREPSKSGDGEGGAEGGEGRVGGSLDRSLALGMRRQMRDTAC